MKHDLILFLVSKERVLTSATLLLALGYFRYILESAVQAVDQYK